jgi:hypothetical protein
MPEREGMLRAGGAAGCAGGGRGGGQSPPVLRRRDAQGRGHGRTAAGLQHHHLRRGAPVARGGGPVLRRKRIDQPDHRTGARHAQRRHRQPRRITSPCRMRRNAGQGGARPAPGGEGREPAPAGGEAGRRAAFRRGFAGGRRDAELGRHLDTQAERGEGLANCLRRAQELVAGHQALAQRRGRTKASSRPRALGRGLFAGDVAEPDAARHRADLPAPDGRPSARLDLHVGHAGGRQQLSRTTAANSAWPTAKPRSGAAPSTTKSRRCSIRAGKHARPVSADVPGSGGGSAPGRRSAPRAGGAFVLCTSLRAMRRIRELLQDKLSPKDSTCRC